MYYYLIFDKAGELAQYDISEFRSMTHLLVDRDENKATANMLNMQIKMGATYLTPQHYKIRQAMGWFLMNGFRMTKN